MCNRAGCWAGVGGQCDSEVREAAWVGLSMKRRSQSEETLTSRKPVPRSTRPDSCLLSAPGPVPGASRRPACVSLLRPPSPSPGLGNTGASKSETLFSFLSREHPSHSSAQPRLLLRTLVLYPQCLLLSHVPVISSQADFLPALTIPYLLVLYPYLPI